MRFSSIFKYRKKTTENGSSSLYLKLRSYFLLTFIVVVLLPFVSFSLLSYYSFKNNIDETISSEASENIEHVSSIMGFILKGMSTYSEMIINNIDSSDVFNNRILRALEASDIPAPIDFDNLKEELDKILSISENTHIPIENLYLIYDNQPYSIYSAQNKNTILDPSTCEAWYRNPSYNTKLLGANMRFYEDGSYNYVISYIKSIKGSKNSKLPLGFLLIDMNYNSMASNISTIKPSKISSSEIYLIDQSNIIMYTSNTALLTTEMDISLSNHLSEAYSKSITVNIDGQDVSVRSRNIPFCDWKIVNVIPIDKSQKYAFFIENYSTLLLLVCILVIFAFSFIIKLIILNPINELTAAVSPYSHNRFRPKIELKKEVDEQPKNRDLNSLSDIQSLIHRVYSTKLEQQETQLKSLQSQINPHFLYNTLESIRGAALYHGIPSIAEMSRCLSSLFRYSISSELLVPIRSEIQNIEEYLAIQNFRHDNKFDLSYNISEKLYDFKILKLTLQPIIENSIKHGLEMKLGKGRIKLSILSLDNTIRIEISDDGLGLPLEKIHELNRKLNEGAYSEESILNDTGRLIGEVQGSGTGIGVQNVNSRIKLYFGEQYGIRYHECHTGATVEIVLPLITDANQ